MRLTRVAGIAITCVAALGLTARAQQAPPPIRPLGAIVATSADSIGDDATFRFLNDGRLLVNEPGQRRLVLFDSTLQHPVIVADATPRTSAAYGRGLTKLAPFTADSSLVFDVATGATIVLDGAGKVARIIRTPPVKRSPSFRSPAATLLGFDQAGDLLYRAPPPTFLALLDPSFVGDTLMTGPDSVAILRVGIATGRVDTVAMLKAARIRQVVSRPAPGRGSGHPAFNPMPAGDDAAVLPDGTLAIVRVDSYRVDHVRDGRLTQGPVIPAPKVPILASAKVMMLAVLRSADSVTDAQRGGPMPGEERTVFVEPSDLPDYIPPFFGGDTFADTDGNVWIRAMQTTAIPGGAVYDVVDRTGVRTERVQLPIGLTLVGFGRGVAYLSSGAKNGDRLVKARLH